MGELLDFKGKVDFTQARKDLDAFQKELSKIGIAPAGGGMAKQFDVKPMTAFQQGVLKQRDALIAKNIAWKDLIITEQKAKVLSAESKAETDKLKIAEQELNNQLKAKTITEKEHALQSKKNLDAQKLAINTQKEADRQANQANKALKDQLSLARQEEAQRERNRKQLQRESSEYYQLDKALNAVRRRTKDVLAAMFDLERQGKKNTAEYKALEQRSKGMVTQTNILDSGIKKIDATLGLHQRHVGEYGLAIEGLSPHFAAINAKLAIFGTSIQQLSQAGGMASLGTSIMDVGKSIGKFLISPVGLAITALTALYGLFVGNKGTVIDFDDKLLSVSKTTNMAGRELMNFGNEAINLSKSLKIVSTDKLLEYSTIAGQLGVKGTADLLAFSEAMAKLETASDISGEDGGKEIARLLTLTDGGVQNIKAFGDEIVNLGNNFAATEKEILANAENIAQNTGIYRVGRQEVLAYATATKATGLEAEVVGSSFNRTLATFEKAIRTGKNIDVLTKATGKSVEELKSQFRDNASGVFNDFIKGLNEVDKSGGSVNEILDSIGITAIRDKRVLATLATNGYEVLARSLDAVKNSAGAMNQEFETAVGKIKNQPAKFGIAWDNLVLSVENGQGIIGRSSVGVVNAFTDIVTAITPNTTSFKINEEQVGKLTKRYDELTEKSKTLGGKTKLNRDEQEELRKVIAEIGILIPGATTGMDQYGNAIDISRDKIVKLTKAQREFNELATRDEVKKANKNFEEAQSKLPKAIKDRQTKASHIGTDKNFIDNINDFLNGGESRERAAQLSADKVTRLMETSYKEAKRIQSLNSELLTKSQKDLIAQVEKGEEIAVKAGATADKITETTETSTGRTTDVIKAEIKDLQESNKKLAVTSKEFKANVVKILAAKKELKLANGGTDTEANREESLQSRTLKSRNTLQKEIDKMIAGASRKQMTADDAEVQSVSEKYAELRKKAKEYYDELNKNIPKNKQVGFGLTLSGIDSAEVNEKQAIIDKQSNARLKIQLAEQAKDFEDFENYKLKYGVEAANKRYQSEYTTAEAYGQKLEELQTKLLSEMSDPADATEGQKEQLKIINDQIVAFADKRKSIDDAVYDNAYNAAKTTAQLLLDVEKEYQKNVKALGATATQDQLDNLEKVRVKAASKVVVGDLTDSDAFTKLFGNLDELAASEISRLVNEIELRFNELSVSFDPIDLEVIRKKLNEAKAMIIKDNPFAQVGASIKAVFEDGADGATKSATQINKEWKNLADSTAGAFKFVDDAIQSCDVLKDAIGEVGSTALSSLSQITSAGIAVSRAVQLAGAASAAVAVTTATAIKTAEKASVILAIISAALTVVQAIAGLFKSIFNAHDKRVEKSIKGHKEQVDELGRAYNRLERDVNDAVGKAVEQAHLRQIENLKQQQAELAKIREAEQSKKKPDQNKINEVNDQIASIGDKIKDTQGAMIELLTGTTAKSISDGIIAGFKNGKRAAADFADDFNGLMEDALLQALKTDFLDVEIANFYKRFAEASKGGLTQDEVERLRAEYTGIIEEGLNLVKDIDKITGGPKKETVSTEALKPNTLTAALNQPTAERLEGLWRGNFELTKQLVTQGQVVGLTMGEMLQIGRSKLAALERIAANTLRSADNTDRLEAMETTLTAIEKNTKPVKSARD